MFRKFNNNILNLEKGYYELAVNYSLIIMLKKHFAKFTKDPVDIFDSSTCTVSSQDK